MDIKVTAQETKKIIEDLAKQNSQALETLDISLPQIIVVGDTSSGKSSLLSALSGIKFPTDSKVCTRCPIEISLHPLRTGCKPGAFMYRIDEDGKSVKTNTEPKTLAEASEWLGTEMKQLKHFSSRRLMVEVTRNNVPSLKLIDLPGIIQDGGEYADDSKKIKEMIKREADKPRTIIMSVVDASGHQANQSPFGSFVRKYSKCRQTLGVLTKADKVHGDEEGRVEELVLNRDRKSTFELGWGVMSCKPELRDDLEKQAEDELKYFCDYEPWRNMQDQKNVFLGRTAVANRLSEILNKQYHDEFPKVMKEVSNKSKEIKAKLDSMGNVHRKNGIRDHFNKVMQRVITLIQDSTLDCDDDFFEQKGTRWKAGVNGLQKDFDKKVYKATERALRGITFSSVRDAYVESMGEPMIGFMSRHVFNQIFQSSFVDATWGKILSETMDRISSFGQEVLERIIVHAIKEYSLPDCMKANSIRLENHVKTKVLSAYMEVVKKTIEETQNRLEEEREPAAVTFSKDVQTTFVQNRNNRLKSQILEQEEKVKFMLVGDAVATALRNIGKSLDATTRVAEDTQMLIHAYTRTARRRFVEHVSSSMRHHLIKFHDKAPALAIKTNVRLWTPDDTLSSIYEMDNQTKLIRNELRIRKQALDCIMRTLEQSVPGNLRNVILNEM